MKCEKSMTVLIVVFLATLFICSSSLSAEEPVGKVVAMEGRAKIIHQGKTIPATLLAEVYPNDTIITARDSKIKVLFSDDSILALGSKSKIVIEKFLYEKKGERRKATFDLTLGKARALLGKKYKDSLYEIKTPTAIAGVRGTHFIVWVVSRGLTQILVLAEEVEVRDVAGIGRQILRENFATRVASGEAPAEPYTPTPGEVNELQSETTVSSEIPEEELPVAPTDVPTEETIIEEEITESSGSVTEEGSTQQDVIDQPPASQPLPAPPCPPY